MREDAWSFRCTSECNSTGQYFRETFYLYRIFHHQLTWRRDQAEM